MDWNIGDRCLVKGVKPGRVVFLGETKFAPGDWAGIRLDEPTGKNNGTVAGHYYFQCEQNHGLFCKIASLKKESEPDGDFKTPYTLGAQSSEQTDPVAGKLNLTESGEEDKTLSPFGMHSSFTASTPNQAPSSSASLELSVGERVTVNENLGILRYRGMTEFAQGEWAGVELDNPMGKNDGSVKGKRYFACKPLYGLFVPVQKVKRAETPASAKFKIRHTKTSALRQKSGSQESLNSNMSVSSFASSASARHKVRLGVTALGTPATHSHGSPARQRMSYANRQGAGASTALAEKEEHIEQLTKEREFDRTQLARAAQQTDEAEQELAVLKAERDKTEASLKKRISELEGEVTRVEDERNHATILLDEEKRKADDLSFQCDEVKAELEELAEAKKALEMAQSEKLKVEEELGKMIEKCRVLESSVDGVKREAEGEGEREKELEDSLSQLRKEVAEWEGRKKVWEQDLASLKGVHKSTQDSLFNETQEKEQAMKEMKSMKEEREADLTKVRKEMEAVEASYRETAEKLEKEVSLSESMRGKVEEAEGALARMKDEETQWKSSLETEQARYAKLATDLSEAQKQHEVALRDHELSQKELERAREENVKLERSMSGLKREMEVKGEREREMEAALAEWRKRDVEWEGEKKTWEALSADLRKEVASLKDSQEMTQDSLRSQLTQEKEDLRGELNEAREVNQRLETERSLWEMERKRMEEKSGGVEEERGVLAREVEDGRTQIRALREEIDTERTGREEEQRIKAQEAAQLQAALNAAQEASSNQMHEVELLKESLRRAETEKRDGLRELAETHQKAMTEAHDLHVRDAEGLKRERRATEERLGALNHAREEERKQWETLVEKMQKKNQHLTKRLTDFKTITSSWKLLVTEHADRQFQAATQGQKEEAERKNLQEEIEKLEKEIRELKKPKKYFPDICAREDEEGSGLEEEVRLEVEKLEESLAEKERSLEDELGDSRKGVEEQIQKLKREIVELKKPKRFFPDPCLLEDGEDGPGLDEEVRLEVEKLEETLAEKERSLMELEVGESRKRLEESLKKRREEVESLRVTLHGVKEDRGNLEARVLHTQESQKEQTDKIRLDQAEMQQRMSDLRTGNEALKVEKKALEEAKESAELACTDLRQRLQLSQAEAKEADSLREEVHKLTTDTERLKAEVGMRTNNESEALLEKERRISELERKYDVERAEWERDAEELQTLQAAVQQLQEIEESHAILQQELHDSKKGAEILMEGAASERSRLENELAELREEVKGRGVEMEEARQTPMTADVEQQQHIDFLNSTIASLKNKNNELLLKINALQTGDIHKLSNGVPRVEAPRLYCDICEKFDVHETEDCPVQAQESQEESQHTRSGGKRGAHRAYCTDCEEFGHETEDCEANKTF